MAIINPSPNDNSTHSEFKTKTAKPKYNQTKCFMRYGAGGSFPICYSQEDLDRAKKVKEDKAEKRKELLDDVNKQLNNEGYTALSTEHKKAYHSFKSEEARTKKTIVDKYTPEQILKDKKPKEKSEKQKVVVEKKKAVAERKKKEQEGYDLNRETAKKAEDDEKLRIEGVKKEIELNILGEKKINKKIKKYNQEIREIDRTQYYEKDRPDYDKYLKDYDKAKTKKEKDKLKKVFYTANEKHTDRVIEKSKKEKAEVDKKIKKYQLLLNRARDENQELQKKKINRLDEKRKKREAEATVEKKGRAPYKPRKKKDKINNED